MNSQLMQFSIFDSKAQAYLQPFFSINRETAVREFTKAVQSDGNFSQFSEDYAMFELGTFDQNTGKSELHATPLHVVNAVTLKGQPTAMASPRELSAERIPWSGGDPNDGRSTEKSRALRTLMTNGEIPNDQP